MLYSPRQRSGAVAVEAAIVYATMFLLLLALIVGGLGVFRYQLVGAMSREAARAASVKGSNYAATTGQASPAQQDIFTTVVQPLAATMDASQLSLTLEFIDGTTGQATPWDKSSKSPTTIDSSTGAPVSNRVRATITYQWSPEFFGSQPLTMRSVCECPISF
jgi:Flp pilus assembly protein TadG